MEEVYEEELSNETRQLTWETIIFIKILRRTILILMLWAKSIQTLSTVLTLILPSHVFQNSSTIDNDWFPFANKNEFIFSTLLSQLELEVLFRTMTQFTILLY